MLAQLKSIQRSRIRKNRTTLTNREIEVIREYCKGLSYKEIASALNLSPKTISVHIVNIYHKLGIKPSGISRIEIYEICIEKGYVTPKYLESFKDDLLVLKKRVAEIEILLGEFVGKIETSLVHLKEGEKRNIPLSKYAH